MLGVRGQLTAQLRHGSRGSRRGPSTQKRSVDIDRISGEGAQKSDEDGDHNWEH